MTTLRVTYDACTLSLLCSVDDILSWRTGSLREQLMLSAIADGTAKRFSTNDGRNRPCDIELAKQEERAA